MWQRFSRPYHPPIHHSDHIMQKQLVLKDSCDRTHLLKQQNRPAKRSSSRKLQNGANNFQVREGLFCSGWILVWFESESWYSLPFAIIWCGWARFDIFDNFWRINYLFNFLIRTFFWLFWHQRIYYTTLGYRDIAMWRFLWWGEEELGILVGR